MWYACLRVVDDKVFPSITATQLLVVPRSMPMILLMLQGLIVFVDSTDLTKPDANLHSIEGLTSCQLTVLFMTIASRFKAAD